MVQVDTWVAAAGKNGMRRDWHVRDYNSGRTILRATRSGILFVFAFIGSPSDEEELPNYDLLAF
jgi:hypothetical protein